MTFSRTTWLTTTLTVALLCDSVSADNWPHWRGPSGTGVSVETRLPESWSDTQNIGWKAPLRGVGVSSPIVWGDRQFLRHVPGGTRCQPPGPAAGSRWRYGIGRTSALVGSRGRPGSDVPHRGTQSRYRCARVDLRAAL